MEARVKADGEFICLEHILYKWVKGEEGIRLPTWDGANKMGSLWFNHAGPSLIITVISAAPFKKIFPSARWGQLHCELNPFPLLHPSLDPLPPGSPEASPHPSIHAKSSKATAALLEGLSGWSSRGAAKCGPRTKKSPHVSVMWVDERKEGYCWKQPNKTRTSGNRPGGGCICLYSHVSG